MRRFVAPEAEAAPRPGARIERIEVTARPQTDTDLRRRAPVAKQVYGREEIDKYGDTSVSDVLKRLPGVNIQGGAQRDLRLGVGYNAVRPTPSATFTYGERAGGLAYSLPISVFEWRNITDSVIERRTARQALFVQDEWEISPQWSTYLGLRSERINTKSSGLADPVNNLSTVTTPLWHVNYKLDPKGRDMVRASITRSYKAPELTALLARPTLSGLFTDTTRPNTEASPDRRGNAALKPELATGLDIAYESYLAGGDMFSIGVFQRSVSDLVRNVTRLQTAPYATVQRYVTAPVNFSRARTRGLEFEVKGRAGELLPQLFDPKLALNLRASLNYYESRVDALPGPNNRLDNQQPWSGNPGFDQRISGLPLTLGASLAYTPGYATRQTDVQSLTQSRARALDSFALWNFSRTMSLRLSANNLAPLDSETASGFLMRWWPARVSEAL